MAEDPISISRVELGPEVEALVLEVLRSGQVAQGPMVERLERAFCELVGVKHAVAVANGTVSLVAALQAIDLQPGDEVITSPFTFVATLNAILEAGARVRFADIDLDDFAMNAAATEAALGPATRAVMPVHLYGQPVDCAAFLALTDKHGCALVEDAAQAHGATFDGRPVGSFGIGSFSLYATKNVATGEGGIVTTNDDAIADRLRLLRNQGMRARYQYELAGHNYRMTDLQAALGLPQMAKLEETTQRREHHAATLSAGLGDIDGLVVPVVQPGRRHVFHQYTVRVTDAARVDRNELSRQLSERSIGSGIYYPKTVFDYDCYREHPLIELSPVPNAERAASEVLSLPVHQLLTSEHLDRIIEGVRKVLA